MDIIMNIEIAKQRYKSVFRPDVINNTKGDFLATHVPMKNLYVISHADVTLQDKKHPMTEEEVFDRFFASSEEDQFVLVKGASGAGKSHLIRWFYTMLELRKTEREIVLPIKRADNTLKGTIKQLIDMPEVQNMPNKNLYKKLASASTTMPEIELKNTIYYTFVNLIESDDGKASEDTERMINRVNRQHLVALLQNSLFKERLMLEDGPIERIYCKFAENKTTEVNDKAAEFISADFELDSNFFNELLNSGADEKARKIANKLIDNDAFVKKIVDYINLFVEKVIQRCAGLEPGDLGLVIQEIRQELYKQGKTLTILIEDITAASGVDDSLLDALLTNKVAYPDKNLCRINSIVGSTDGYYVDKFRVNTKARIENFINVSDDMFNNDVNGLVEFFARYLNTISLPEDAIDKWLGNKADPDLYPVHEVTIGNGWDEFKLGNSHINLFPFSSRAITFLYKKQDSNMRHPRALMRDILEPYIKNSLEDLQDYPKRRSSLEGMDPTLQNTIYNRNDLDDNTKIRLTQFMYIWGDGTNNVYSKDGVRYIGGIADCVYEQLGLPLLDGKQVETPTGEDEDLTQIDPPKPVTPDPVVQIVKENEQVAIALKEVDKWIENVDYKLNIGQTTANVRALNEARKNMNAYLYAVIDWASEGVPIDAMVRVRDTSNKFLVSFERQTMKSDSVVVLPASIESRKIIEAFVRWSEVGGKSWNFEGSTDYLFRVQKWTESIKPIIVKSIMRYEETEIDYFSFAAAAEFYRLIFNGQCKSFQKPQNFNVEMLLKKNVVDNASNGHTKNWNDLLKKMNGSDGNDARNCVLQYYNLPQGTAVTSTNYEFDYISFNKAVRKVINTGLKYGIDDLQLEDPVRKRRLMSEYLKYILDRIDTVVSGEKNALNEVIDVLGKVVDLDDIDDEEDIKEIITSIKKFYNQAQISHISVAIHYDVSLINSCNKNAGAIVSAIKTANQIKETTDTQELLLKFSKDPVFALSDFAKLLTLTNSDLVIAKQEVANRMNNVISAGGGNNTDQYNTDKENLQECKKIIAEVK
ncbi:MAG: hypothetical protein E7B61_12915 [Clostridiales bacterium]|nr:hypothetical protein [Clostridiales bacterium]